MNLTILPMQFFTFNGIELSNQNQNIISSDSGTWTLNDSEIIIESETSDLIATYTVLALTADTLEVSIVTENISNIPLPEGFPESTDITIKGQGTFTRVQ